MAVGEKGNEMIGDRKIAGMRRKAIVYK